MMVQKKIWLNGKKTRYCYCRIYSTLKEMRDAIKEFRPQDKYPKGVQGQCAPYEWIKNNKSGKDIATIFFCVDNCGAGIVSHELMHACFWAYKFKKYKKQYPIIINSMEDEEKILYELTYVVRQFYNWFYTVAKQVPTGKYKMK